MLRSWITSLSRILWKCRAAQWRRAVRCAFTSVSQCLYCTSEMMICMYQTSKYKNEIMRLLLSALHEL